MANTVKVNLKSHEANEKKFAFVLWNPAPCTPIEICSSDDLNAIVKMGAIGPPKGG
jgi:hypothetical protein